jgi:hypothetical protein
MVYQQLNISFTMSSISGDKRRGTMMRGEIKMPQQVFKQTYRGIVKYRRVRNLLLK